MGSVPFALPGVIRGSRAASLVLVWLGFDHTEEWAEDLLRGERAGRVRVGHVWETSGGVVAEGGGLFKGAWGA